MFISLSYTFGGPEKDLDLKYTHCFIYKVYFTELYYKHIIYKVYFTELYYKHIIYKVHFTNADIRAGKTVPSNNEKIPLPFC